MNCGEYFAVGKARCFETLLMEPDDLLHAAHARDYNACANIIMSRPFGRMLDEKSPDFGIGAIIKKMSAVFSSISSSGNFFTLDAKLFLDFLSSAGESEIKEAVYKYTDPFDFYRFAYEERLRLRGEISGEKVLRYIWLCILFQARLIRMILISQKMSAVEGYEVS